MLRTINSRLELLLDRDHLIGHAYFMSVQEEPTIEKLKEVFAMNILPLLSEYFYADLGRVGLVLGEPFVRRLGSRVTLAAFDHEAADQLADRATYRLTPVESLSIADFRSIYEPSEGDDGLVTALVFEHRPFAWAGRSDDGRPGPPFSRTARRARGARRRDQRQVPPLRTAHRPVQLLRRPPPARRPRE